MKRPWHVPAIRLRSRAVVAGAVVGLLGALTATPGNSAVAAPSVFEGPVPRAESCAPGDRPETGLQGQVPLADRASGRSRDGYNCNLKLVGSTNPAGGASWQMAWYDDCAYYDTKLQPGNTNAGVQVIDVSDSKAPRRSTNLLTPAMQDPWESLKVNEERGLLASVAGWNGFGPAFFDLYSVKSDCANPALQASLPVNIPIGHEGEWAPDGKTYYGAALFAPTITAIDTTIPLAPHPVAEIPMASHGMSLSDDGTRMYLASYLTCGTSGTATGNGMTVVDVSQIQARNPAAVTRIVGSVCWSDGGAAQHTIPVTIQGTPYVISVDEGGMGMARIIDISDETKPVVISKLKLEIDMPQHAQTRSAEASGQGSFAYNAHYCSVPQREEPGVVGCSYFNSGVRVFDIRDPYQPKEIAYYNVGGSGASPASSQRGSSNATSAYASAQVRFVPERSEVWFTDQDKGFFVTRFADDPATGRPIWPFSNSS